MKSKPITIKCICGKKFEQYKSNHRFCSRKCFLKDYRERRYGSSGFPLFACEHCGAREQLDYYPRLKKNKERWYLKKCLTCGKRRIGEDKDPE